MKDVEDFEAREGEELAIVLREAKRSDVEGFACWKLDRMGALNAPRAPCNVARSIVGKMKYSGR